MVNFDSEVSVLTGYSSFLGGLNVSKGAGMCVSLVGAIGAFIFGIYELRKNSGVTKKVLDTTTDIKV